MGADAPPGARSPIVAGGPLVWPADWGTRFTICVDTEEEFDWSRPLRRDAAAVTAVAAIPAAHRRFADHGAALTYLVDHPVVRDQAAIAAIASTLADGRSTVGTQLHPWVNPPFDEDLTPANSFAGNLPLELEAAKLDALTAAITTAFGRRPILYRAGRYGLGARTLRLLAERGYRFDSSIRPGYDYSAEGGPDFALAPARPWRSPDGVIELPLTTVFIGRLHSARLYRAFGRVPRGRGLLARAGLTSRIALTPEDMPLVDVREAIRIAQGERLPLLNFSFHSPTLVPGHTPYTRDATDLAEFWRWWDTVLDDLARLGIPNACLGDIAAAIRD